MGYPAPPMAMPIEPLRDPAAFDVSLHKPARPNLEAATDAAKGARGAQAAWEALATRGVIPLDWVDAPARRFYRGMSGGGPSAFPQNVECCVAFAASVPTVLRAEALAHEAAARLDVVGLAPPSHTLWRIDTSPPTVVAKPIDPLVRALVALPWADGEVDREPGRASYAAHVTPRDVLRAESLWDAAARRGWTLSLRARGVPLDASRNPFTPLCDLWQLGYVPVSLLAGRAFLFASRPIEAYVPPKSAT